MEPARSLKEQLFDTYVANLDALREFCDECAIPPRTYVCPLCCQGFGIDTLQDTEALTVEHSIPGALGGTKETATLTCKRCNNTGGTLLDAHLANRFASEQFIQGLKADSTRSWVEIEGARVRANVRIEGEDEQQIHFELLQKHTNPRDFDKVRRILEGKRTGSLLQVGVAPDLKFSPLNARVALLRIGFLLMFRQFGYGYALSPGAQVVREQILAPNTELIPDITTIDLDTMVESHGSPPAIVIRPAEYRAFCVPVTLTAGTRTVHKGVLLPGPRDETGEVYQRLAVAKASGTHLRFRFQSFEYAPEELATQEGALLAHLVWDALSSKDQDVAD